MREAAPLPPPALSRSPRGSAHGPRERPRGCGPRRVAALRALTPPALVSPGRCRETADQPERGAGTENHPAGAGRVRGVPDGPLSV